jgi:hypothetical protein
MNFMKLKNNLDISDYVVNETFISYGITDDKKIFTGIKYSKIDTSFESKIFSLIPKEYQQYFNMSVMELNWTIPPHTDSGITATINCYVKTGNCTTHFYKLKSEIGEPKTPKWSPSTQTTGRMFSLDDLDEVDRFDANPGEIYLLNVSQPHSVRRPPNVVYVDRVAICLQSNKFNFNETKELLEITGNL